MPVADTYVPDDPGSTSRAWGRMAESVALDLGGGLIKLPTGDEMVTEIWESACDVTIDGEPGPGSARRTGRAST